MPVPHIVPLPAPCFVQRLIQVDSNSTDKTTGTRSLVKKIKRLE
jgi:hypothetical protein